MGIQPPSGLPSSFYPGLPASFQDTGPASLGIPPSSPCPSRSESILGETYKPTDSEVQRVVQTASLLLNPEWQSRLTKMAQPTGSRLASVPRPPDVPSGAVPCLRELLLGPGMS